MVLPSFIHYNILYTMIKTGIYTYLYTFLILTHVSEIISFNIEELKHINYEVDILQTPIRKDELTQPSILMKSKFGQEYKCILPLVEEEEFSKKDALANDKNMDIKELLKPLQSRPCLLKVQDWWTYEICLGSYIKQFHIEEGHILGQVITLGHYESDFDWSNETNQEKFKNVKQPYHAQWYVNGTKCDLTGQPRNAEIRLVCEADTGDYVYRVDEQETCSYIVTIHTSSICSHPKLKPKLVKKAHTIPCHPILNDEQYNKYMQKLKEEKELEEEKRSQWLKNQQKRLQDMKNENLKQIEKDQTESNNIDTEEKNDVKDDTIDKKKVPKQENEKNSEEVNEAKLAEDYNKEIDRLKSFFSPYQFSEARSRIQLHFDKLLTQAEKDQNPALGGEAKVATLHKLTSTLNMLLAKLDKAEQDALKATEELIKATEMLSKTDKNQGGPKAAKDDSKQTPMPAEDELHVRIKRLNPGSLDTSEKLYEMSSIQKKKLEQAVKERLERVGWGSGDRKIEVKIITDDPFDNNGGNKFDSLTEEEALQFQNMIMSMLTGQQESVKEMERHKRLEENYRHNWEKEKEDD